MLWAKLPLLLHLIIELPAAVSFICKPRAQLPGASVDAVLILNSYGGLLLSTDILCALVLWRDGFDETSVMVCFSLGVYHLFPIRRAYVRLSRGGGGGIGTGVLGGPGVHLVAHLVCLVTLLMACVFGTRF